MDIKSQHNIIPRLHRVYSYNLHANDESNRCKIHFASCFKKSDRYIKGDNINYNLSECDYMVEKLVVKCVPLEMFTILKNFSESHDQQSAAIYSDSHTIAHRMIPTSSPSATDTISVYSVLSDAYPILQFPKNMHHEYVRSKGETRENYGQCTYKTSIHFHSEMHKTKEDQILHKFNALHPDLKESERVPKDPCPLNATKYISVSQSCAEDLSKNESVVTTDLEPLSTMDYSRKRLYDRKMRNASTSIELDTQYVKNGLSNQIKAISATNNIRFRSHQRSITRLISSCYKGNRIACEFHGCKPLKVNNAESTRRQHAHYKQRSFDKTVIHADTTDISKIPRKSSSLFMSSAQLGRLLTKFPKEKQTSNSQDDFPVGLSNEKVKAFKSTRKTEHSSQSNITENLLRWKIIIKNSYPFEITLNENNSKNVGV